MDRDFAYPLDVGALAAVACVSESNFIRSFKATFGETPHRYPQRRRIERAMYLLRTTDRNVTQVCMESGFSSLGIDFGIRDPFGNAIRIGQMFDPLGA